MFKLVKLSTHQYLKFVVHSCPWDLHSLSISCFLGSMSLFESLIHQITILAIINFLYFGKQIWKANYIWLIPKSNIWVKEKFSCFKVGSCMYRNSTKKGKVVVESTNMHDWFSLSPSLIICLCNKEFKREIAWDLDESYSLPKRWSSFQEHFFFFFYKKRGTKMDHLVQCLHWPQIKR